jgi:hypothetical protein
VAHFRVIYEFDREAGVLIAQEHKQLIEAEDFDEAQQKALDELSKPYFVVDYEEQHGDDVVVTQRTILLTRFVRRFCLVPDHDM